LFVFFAFSAQLQFSRQIQIWGATAVTASVGPTVSIRHEADQDLWWHRLINIYKFAF
jgi:hypothetical protein